VYSFDNMIERSKDDMIEKTTIEADTPLSLDLAFNWVKDVLINQSHAADILEAKATALFSVATIILSIGISAGVLVTNGVKIGSIVFGVLALVSYGWVVGCAIAAMRLRRYETLDNPIEIRKWFWDMKPAQFKIELLTHLENSYSNNDKSLSDKTNATRWLVAATATEVIFLVISLAFSL